MCRFLGAVLVSVVASLWAGLVSADDWPQWMGPQRDSVWRETGIVKSFPVEGPKILWRTQIAGGYSGPAVAEGRVFVMDYVTTGGKSTLDFNNRDRLQGRERIHCLDAATGKLLWRRAYKSEYNISYATGPRCTPTVVDGKVYTLGAEGRLLCLDAKTGKPIWSRELKADYKLETPLWGFCGHPLVDGKQLICLVGGEGSVAVSFDRNTGKELWRSLSAREPGYCPPTIIEAGGKRQLLIWDAETINGLDAANGHKYWSVPLEPSFGMSIAAPRKSGNLLFASGYRDTSVLLRLHDETPAASEVWRGPTKGSLFCAISTPFIEGDMIYGTDCITGHLCGVRLADGKRQWETLVPTAGGDRRTSHGTAFLVKHEDRFFLFSETGHLIVARLSPQGYEEICRAKLLAQTGSAFGRNVVWSHPAYANRCVYARNDKEIVCASLSAE